MRSTTARIALLTAVAALAPVACAEVAAEGFTQPQLAP
jgi:hypothetical protein